MVENIKSVERIDKFLYIGNETEYVPLNYLLQVTRLAAEKHNMSPVFAPRLEIETHHLRQSMH